MGRKNKLRKFSEILSFSNVFENYDPSDPKLVGDHFREIELKSKWRELYFLNRNPITLELACGKADYTIALAQKYPNRNFIGVDVKGARIWKGAKAALDQNLKNVAFLRTRIEQIDLFFGREEVQEIWITFPDPFPRKSKSNRRLSSPAFLNRYRNVLCNKGLIHLKTDDDALFHYSLEIINNDDRTHLEYMNDNIYGQEFENSDLAIQTYYEKMHLKNSKKIKYIRFYLD